MAELENNMEIKGMIHMVWEKTSHFSNRVLQHAHIYGFELMNIPDPDVHKIYQTLSLVVIPILEKVADSDHLDPEDGIKIANIKQLVFHLRNIVHSIDTGDKVAFVGYVDLLNKEAFL